MKKGFDPKTEQQLALEAESVEWGKTDYFDKVNKAHKTKAYTELPPGVLTLQYALEDVAHAMKLYRKKGRNGGAGKGVHLVSLIEPLTDMELAYVVLRTVINEAAYEQPIQRFAIRVANAVLDQIEYKKFKEGNPGYLHAIEERLKTRHAGHRRRTILMQKRKQGIQDEPWNDDTKCLLGLRLTEIIIETVGYIEKAPIRVDNKTRYVVKMTDEAADFFQKTNERAAMLSPVYQPMVVPPVEWNDIYGGGFLSDTQGKLKLISTRNKKTLQAKHDMPLVYRAVNALQNTPWRINRRVLEVMEEAWARDSDMGVLPSKNGKELPPKPWTSDEEFKKMKKKQPEVVKQWKIEASQVYEFNYKEAANRFSTEFKLKIARKFVDEPEIFFVWYCDWRGRLYPLQNFLNPQADDIGKSLLQFAKGKPLGERGAYWLAVHGANCFGEVDKEPFDIRVQWIKDHETQIRACIEDPFENRFWTEADEPWQFLAFCYEWAGYLEQGPDFVSHLPVNMDGSCNGLQHYSALLLDEEGGKYTNLVPSDRPQDIYNKVSSLVIQMVEQDLKNRKEWRKGIRYCDMAAVWSDKIDRGICKRPVMTTPYGVTKRGIMVQIKCELNDRDSQQSYLEGTDNWQAAMYLSEKIDLAIGETVKAAKEGEAWLKAMVKLFLEAGKPMVWTTPSGFTVRQEVYDHKTVVVNTVFGKTRLQLHLNKDTADLSSTKQVNGIAPNFIHSMDATHLVLTVNKCLDEGITDFSMIHDSFGTHAAEVDRLHGYLRYIFVQMYSEPKLKSILRQLKKQLPEELHEKIPPVPKMGKLELNNVLKSPYFFA